MRLALMTNTFKTHSLYTLHLISTVVLVRYLSSRKGSLDTRDKLFSGERGATPVSKKGDFTWVVDRQVVKHCREGTEGGVGIAQVN